MIPSRLLSACRLGSFVSLGSVVLVCLMACTVSSGPARPAGDAAGARGHEPAHIEGEVLGVDEVPPGDRMAGNVRVQLSLRGKPIDIVLAPGWYLDEKGFKLERHRRVQVVEASREGSAIIARSIHLDGRLLELRDAEGKPMWGIEAAAPSTVGSTTGTADSPSDESDDDEAKSDDDDSESSDDADSDDADDATSDDADSDEE